MGKMNSGLFSSNDMTWETPIDLFKRIDEVYNFTLDVCAVKETAKCENFYSPEIDGLKQSWKGCCWLNPPYGREQIKWITKAYEDSVNNNATVVCLIPARPDTRVWHNIIFKYAKGICFIKGRLKFSGKDSAPFPSALVVFGDKPNKEQAECFKELGAFVSLSYFDDKKIELVI